MNLQETVVEPQSAGTRLDLFLTRCLPDIMKGEGFSRSGVQKLIAEGQITLNGKPAKASARLKTNDLVAIKVLPPKGLPWSPSLLPSTLSMRMVTAWLSTK